MFGLSYWFLPLFAGCVWLGTLLAMLGTWIAKGSPRFPWMQSYKHIAFMSDIGASSWGKPLFITGSAVAVVVFDLAFISERWLRHTGRLTKNYNRTEKILSNLSIVFALIGAAGLLLLTIQDTARHPTMWTFIIDFLPAVRNRHRDPHGPHLRRRDDEAPGETEVGGNMIGGPVYSGGGYQHEHENGIPMKEREPVAPSRNF
ncbi:hypothetical protein K470DRAFT_260471 [Piedraia hortae CBS 480.64]|uniref:CWH43-like N-terminal domain-containing protein n=1 Tax=Piedraia hortae CBS 480.64 TaxID=1314780 RepID=A0A6A7BSP8_9PEZI|nr:hypothetical protein K470DRAFT_260471 [Piedraia hortae CBS 480.64]